MLAKSNMHPTFLFLGLLCLPMAFFSACGTNMVLDPAGSVVEGTEITGTLLVPVLASADEAAPLFEKAVAMTAESAGLGGAAVSLIDKNENTIAEATAGTDGTFTLLVSNDAISQSDSYVLQGVSSDTVLKKLISDLATLAGSVTAEAPAVEINVNADDTILYQLTEVAASESGCASLLNCLRDGVDISFLLAANQDLITRVNAGSITKDTEGSEGKFVQMINALRTATVPGQASLYGLSSETLITNLIRGDAPPAVFADLAERFGDARPDSDAALDVMDSTWKISRILGSANLDADIRAMRADATQFETTLRAFTRFEDTSAIDACLEKEDYFFDSIKEGILDGTINRDNAAANTAIIAAMPAANMVGTDDRAALRRAMQNVTGDMTSIGAQAATMARAYEAFANDGRLPADFDSFREVTSSLFSTLADGFENDRDYLGNIRFDQILTSYDSAPRQEDFEGSFDANFFDTTRPADYVPPNGANAGTLNEACQPNPVPTCASANTVNLCMGARTTINNMQVNCFWNQSCFPKPWDRIPCMPADGSPPPAPGGAIMLLTQSVPGFSGSPSSFYCHTGGCFWTNSMDGKLYAARMSLTNASLQPVQANFEYAPLAAATAIQVVVNPGGDTYFWTDNTGLKLYSAPQGGLGPVSTILTSTQARGYGSRFIVIETNAFWTDPNSGNIRRIPVNITDQTDGNVVTVKGGLLSPMALSSVVTQNGTFLLFSQYDVAEPNKIRIYKLPFPVNGASPTLLATEIRGAGIIPAVMEIDAAGALVAWISVNVDPVTRQPILGTYTVNGVNMDGSGYQVFQTGLANAISIRVSGGKIYVTDRGNLGIGNPGPPLNDGKVLRYSVPPAPQPDILVNGIAPRSINIVENYGFYSTMAGAIGRFSTTQPPL